MAEATGSAGRKSLRVIRFPLPGAVPSARIFASTAAYARSDCDDREVWQAALLHDAGKYINPESQRYVSLPYCVAVVLLAASSIHGPEFAAQAVVFGCGGGVSREGTGAAHGLALPFLSQCLPCGLGQLLAATGLAKLW